MNRARTKKWLLPALIAAALCPASFVVLDAMADEKAIAESPAEAKRRVLASMPNDATVLINVTGREMPASPDVLALGKKASPALERCLADNGDEGLRRSAAILLARIGDRHALGALQTALDDWDADVRHSAMDALRR